MKKTLLTILCFFIVCQLTRAQIDNSFPTSSNLDDVKIKRNNVIEGIVFDKQTNKPIPAATIRIVGSNKGTICGKDGTFRLPKGNFFKGSDIKITSVGYHTKVLTLDLRDTSITIFLEQNPVELSAAVVIGEIEVNEIIKRAIKKKEENRTKYKTMQGLLYSKFTIDMSKLVNNYLIGTNKNSINLGIDISPEKNEKRKKDSLLKDLMKGFIGETFSQKYIDIEKEIDKTIIVNRRNTANFPKAMNNIVLEKFVDFSLDEIDFLDAKIITPLHKNAISHYKFKLLERKLFDNKYIYIIEVTPNTKVYPTFEGTISIIEGTYQLIEAKLKPSADTKIHLIDDIEWYEKFENISNDIWFPTYMENKASFKAKLFPLIPPIELEWTATSIFSDVILDQPLPDSVYYDSVIYNSDGSYTEHKTKKYNNDGKLVPLTIVLPDADSTKKEYWEDNALIALTEKEQEMYTRIDTAAKELGMDTIINFKNFDSLLKTSNSYSYTKNKFSFNYMPIIRANRVEDFIVGLMPDISVSYIKLSGTGAYSTGQHRWFGNAKLEIGNNLKNGGLFSMENIISLVPSSKLFFSVGSEIFSEVRLFGKPFTNPDFYWNTIDVWITKRDYFDYYRTDGWNTQINFSYKKLNINIIYENKKDFVLGKSTYKGWWTSGNYDKFRDNPHSETGNFQSIKLTSTFGKPISSFFEIFQYKFDLNFLHGIRAKDKSISNINKGEIYSQVYGSATVQFPIFETGYGNILMLLSAAGGRTTNNTPVQNLFVIEQSSFISNLFVPTDNTFITAYENYLGGTEFYSYHARLNLRDWWWRWLHLPKIKKRGLELSFAGTVGRFFNNGTTELSNLYRSTENGYYSEVGFRIGRIPIPGTDFIYWSLETRFGLGEYAKGRVGFLLNFQLVF